MHKSIIYLIKEKYNEFTNTEKVMADYFLSNEYTKGLSGTQVAEKAFVSEATLSRFSQKLGFQGYREFIFVYERYLDLKEMKFDNLTRNVLNTYNGLLEQTNDFINENQLNRIVDMIIKSKKIYVYGLGNSGMCAREFEYRFMRLGINVKAIVDQNFMGINTNLIDIDTLLIAVSISGAHLNDYLTQAKNKGAKTIYISANNKSKSISYTDEFVQCAIVDELDAGRLISPQFPVLVIIDIIYAHLLKKIDVNMR